MASSSLENVSLSCGKEVAINLCYKRFYSNEKILSIFVIKCFRSINVICIPTPSYYFGLVFTNGYSNLPSAHKTPPKWVLYI